MKDPFLPLTISGSGSYFVPAYQAQGRGPKFAKLNVPLPSGGGSTQYDIVVRRFYRSGVLAGEVQLYQGTGLDMDPISTAFDRVLDPGQSFTLNPTGPTPVRVTTRSVSVDGATVDVAVP